jgi:hypothetical protein
MKTSTAEIKTKSGKTLKATVSRTLRIEKVKFNGILFKPDDEIENFEKAFQRLSNTIDEDKLSMLADSFFRKYKIKSDAKPGEIAIAIRKAIDS